MRRFPPLRPSAFLLAVAFTFSACGGGDDPEPGLLSQARQAGQAVQGLQEMGEKLEQQANVPPADPVDFRRLKDLLPDSTADRPRTGSEGSRQGMGDFNVSQAEATYTVGADGRATVLVVDMGGAQAAMLFGAAWTLMSVDRETDSLYERTAQVEGYPGYESYNRSGRSGEVQALVADRFLVKVSGQNVDDGTLRDLLRGVDLRALEGMRDEGRRPA